MENRYENKAIYFTRAECDYLRNLVEQNMRDDRSRKNEAPEKLYVWNVLETGDNE